jgi:hypothetical protein
MHSPLGRPTRSVTASAVLLAPSERQLEHIHRKLEVNERLSAAQRAAAMDIRPEPAHVADHQGPR